MVPDGEGTLALHVVCHVPRHEDRAQGCCPAHHALQLPPVLDSCPTRELRPVFHPLQAQLITMALLGRSYCGWKRLRSKTF